MLWGSGEGVYWGFAIYGIKSQGRALLDGLMSEWGVPQVVRREQRDREAERQRDRETERRRGGEADRQRSCEVVCSVERCEGL